MAKAQSRKKTLSNRISGRKVAKTKHHKQKSVRPVKHRTPSRIKKDEKNKKNRVIKKGKNVKSKVKAQTKKTVRATLRSIKTKKSQVPALKSKEMMKTKKIKVAKVPVKKTKKIIRSATTLRISKQSVIDRRKRELTEAMQQADQTLVSQILGLESIQPYQPRKGESYMSESMREHFQKILLAWKRQLMQEADRTMVHMKDEAANYPDLNDRATQEEEFGLELRARDRERKLIRKIDEALALLKEGEYGYCEGCGVEIGLRRLEARPTAMLCIDCKMLDEIREKQNGV